MRGIALIMDESGPRFDETTSVRDFAATMQNTLVNLGTNGGSDPVYSDRGTDLSRDGAEGRMMSNVWAAHSSNFAAMKTLSFSQQTNKSNDLNRLRSLRLQLEEFKDGRVKLRVQGTSVAGETLGLLLSL